MELISFPKTKRGCINENGVLADNLKIVKIIGRESRCGEVCLAKTLKGTKNVAIKKIPMTNSDYLLVDKPISMKTILKSEAWTEIFLLMLTKSLVSNNITPHLPTYSEYYVCDDCSYSNKNITPEIVKTKKCFVLVNPLAVGDLADYLKRKNNQLSDIMSAYIQIFLGIFVLHDKYNIFHGDLHYGNVLFRKTKAGLIKYILDDKEYIINNRGLLFYLWDFGRATILEPGKTSESFVEDYTRIGSMITDKRVMDSDTYKVIESMLFKKPSNAREMIHFFLSSMNEKVKSGDKILKTYDMN